MRVKILLAAVASAMVVGLMPSPAHAVDVTAADGTVLADLTTSGTRSITLVDPIVASSTLNAAASTTYGVTVVELARTGTANWTVSAKLCGATTGLKDCTGAKDNALSSTTSSAILPGSAVTLDNRAVSENDTPPVGTPGTTSSGPSGGGPAALSGAAELFNAAQNTGTLYTEVYSASGDVSFAPPPGQAAEVYEGFFVVTLV